MPDYEPLDLTTLCNAGAAFIGSDAAPLLGLQQYHGLPFLIGSDPAHCLIGFTGREDSVVAVAVGQAVRTVLVAHVLLETRLTEGEAPGYAVARYTFRYADGTEEAVPIRERFEVAEAPTIWGQWPFLAQPDRAHRLMPRHEGRWEEAGRRQAEVVQATARDYYLWCWTNPHPEKVVESILLTPTDRRFVVAAITLGHRDEHPFPRRGNQDVLITLPQPEDAARPFGLEVEVDRGTTTFPYPLPTTPAEPAPSPAPAGWGEPANAAASPAYVQISATPSATVVVKQDGEELGRASWGELEAQGKVGTPRVRLEVVDRGRNWTHVTVLDEETGKPVPCRVHFRSPEGIPYQPHGHHPHLLSNQGTWHVDIGGDLRLGQTTYAYIDGRCQGWLPRGEVLVDIARGFEYEPLRQRVTLKPGQRELELRLRRITNMNARRWFSGDTHVHFLGTQGAHREAQGEDLDVVNLLQSQWGHLFTNTEDWTGHPSVSRDGESIVYCTQENRQHILGHLTLLGLKEPVMPWCTDGPSESEIGGTLEATMSDWADRCHAQGGTVVIPHLPNPNGEPAVLIATGRADAVEMMVHGGYQHLEYYRYLNGGYRLPLVGGTDKMSAEVPVGLCRTYAQIPADEEFNYDSWCRAVRAGRTFLSGGPLIEFTVDGVHIGDTLKMPPGGGTVEVEARVESIFPVHTLQIVQQGRVVASTEEAQGARRLHLRARLQVPSHTWLAARCGGPGYHAIPHHDVWKRGVFAHTSPVYVAVGGEWELFDRDTAEYMLTLIHGGLSYVHHTALHHPAGTVTHHHGMEDHVGYLESPFKEALAAIHRRMHELGVPH